MEVLLEGRPIQLTPAQAIGKGGEADVYGVRGNWAVKIFKDPTHPDLLGNRSEQEAARRRLTEQQKKLADFPRDLPDSVIVPEKLVYDRTGRIVGYAMRRLLGVEPLVKLSDRSFRNQGVSNQKVVELFQQIHRTVSGLHAAGVVIGDFNDLNIMFAKDAVYFIDSDSYQFGPYLCSMFTHRFLDPLLAGIGATELVLKQPYTKASDWYAYSVMLMQALVFVGPYGGVYRPKAGKIIPADKRPLRRITVFHPEVIYPKPALPLQLLSDDLLGYLEKVFVRDVRGEFPENLVNNLLWVKCSKCGLEHMRTVCPKCRSSVTPVVRKQLTKVRGQVVATEIFRTAGIILIAQIQNGQLAYLYNENDTFFREGGLQVLNGKVNLGLKFQLQGSKTIISQGNQAIVLDPVKQPERLVVENCNNLPQIVSNGTELFWTLDGQLLKRGSYGPEFWGNVLPSQTQFWAGSKFGFGYYRAGTLSIYFVFGTGRLGIRDDIKLPRIAGQILESEAIFSEQYCWFMLSVQERHKTINYCYMLDQNGQVIATASREKGDGSWLSEIKGKAAFRNSMFVPTNDGIVRIDNNAGRLEKTTEFPDTEPFVNSNSQLLIGEGGLYIVEPNEIWHLKLK